MFCYDCYIVCYKFSVNEQLSKVGQPLENILVICHHLHQIGSDGLVDQNIDAMVDGSFLEVLENTREGPFADEVDTHEVGVRLFN